MRDRVASKVGGVAGQHAGRDHPVRLGEWVNVPALAAVLIWSGVFPIAKFALDEFPTLAYTGLRPLLAAALMFGLLRLRGEPLGIARADWPRLAAACLGGMALFQVAFILGLERTSAGHSAFLTATSPLLGALILWAFRGVRPGRRAALGLALGIAGVALLVGAGAGDDGASLAGDGLTVLAALGAVGITVLPAPLVPRYGALRVTAWLILAAGLVTLPLAALDLAAVARDVPSPLAWASLLYSAVLGMSLANVLWQRAVGALGAAQTMVYFYLQPFLATLLAALLLGERPGAAQLLGGAVTLVGVALVRRA